MVFSLTVTKCLDTTIKTFNHALVAMRKYSRKKGKKSVVAAPKDHFYIDYSKDVFFFISWWINN